MQSLLRIGRVSEPIVVSEFWKNRRGESVRVILSTFADRNLVDVRTWYSEDGRLKPGKGFSAEVRHLRRLALALSKAFSKANELGLIATEDDGADQ